MMDYKYLCIVVEILPPSCDFILRFHARHAGFRLADRRVYFVFQDITYHRPVLAIDGIRQIGNNPLYLQNIYEVF